MAVGTMLGLALAVASVVNTAQAQAASKPTRIVSLDLCADQLLIELVERERIAAVTFLADDPSTSAIWKTR